MEWGGRVGTPIGRVTGIFCKKLKKGFAARDEAIMMEVGAAATEQLGKCEGGPCGVQIKKK